MTIFKKNHEPFIHLRKMAYAFPLLLFVSMFVFFISVLEPGSVWAWPWSHDLFDQPSYKAQEDAAPPRPEGIVPFNKTPVIMHDRIEAAQIKNPIPPDKASLTRGEAMFNRYCAVCHGKTGIGDGIVGKKYVPPTDLTTAYVQSKPDGELFYTITNGGLYIMPSYGDSVEIKDRWNIVNYMKHVLGQ